MSMTLTVPEVDKMNRGKELKNSVGFDLEQMQLAIDLFNTQMEAPFKVRSGNEEEGWVFTPVIGLTSPISFAEPGSGKFVLKSHDDNKGAPLSPIYINLRKLPKKLYDQMAKAMKKTLDVMEFAAGKFDFITGIPEAGLPIARALSELTGIPFMEIFEKSVTSDGRQIVAKKMDIDLTGKRFLVIDDLITKMHTKKEAKDACDELGIIIIFLVLVDREQGGVQELKKLGVDIIAIYKMTELLKFYLDNEMISESQYNTVIEYLKNNS